jgi:hypothetical protein
VTRALLAASRRLPAGLLAAALWLAPQAALACAVCGSVQRPAVGRAYFYGAIAMSLIPLLAAVGAVVFLRRRARALAAAERGAAGAPRGPVPSRG